MTRRNCTALRSIGNENLGYLKLSELQGMERSRSKDRGSLGIELGTTCTEGRVLTNCATLVLRWRHVITIARHISVFCVLCPVSFTCWYGCVQMHHFLTFQLGQQNGHSDFCRVISRSENWYGVSRWLCFPRPMMGLHDAFIVHPGASPKTSTLVLEPYTLELLELQWTGDGLELLFNKRI